MLKMGISIPILGCFTFLLAMTVSPALCTISDESIRADFANPDIEPDADNDNQLNRCTTDHGFLIGEKTPVWVAHRPDPAMPVNYTMLERGIVKEAIADWRAREPFGLKNIKRIGNGQEYTGFSRRPVARYRTLPGPPTYRPGTCFHYRHIHVLVMMDYPSSWPANEKDQQKYIKDKILYAVAFWNAIHYRLWDLDTPHYQIRIAGIIIGRNKQATPYLRAHEKDGVLNLKASAQEMITYWENVAKTEGDFPLDARQVIATMTESRQRPGDIGWVAAGHDGHHGMVYSDDLAVGVMAELTPLSLLPSLRVWCEAGLKYYPHLSSVGKAIWEPPLPGQLISPNKQCEAHGWYEDNFVCFMKSHPCNYLVCKNDRFLRSCTNTLTDSPALDGTFCTEGSLCLDRFCIAKNLLNYGRRGFEITVPKRKG